MRFLVVKNMMLIRKLVFLFLLSIGFGCSESNTEELPLEPEIEASADILGLSVSDTQDPNSSYLNYDVNENVIGSARFYQIGNVVTLELTLEGQEPNGSQAVHIHNGTLGKPLRHWNQAFLTSACNVPSMGGIWAKPFAGDVGNVPIDQNGNGTLIVQSDLWALNTGDERDILDKVIIVHAQPQDFLDECSPTHDHSHAHNNQKIGGGKITLLSDVPQVQSMIPSRIVDFKVCN